MSSTYEGPATVIAGDVQVPVTVRLSKRESRGLTEWDGTIQATGEQVHPFEAIAWDGSEFHLRLPNGNQGRGFVSQLDGGTGHASRFVGNGLPPW